MACEQLEPRQLLSTVIASASKDGQTFFGNVAMTTSAQFEQAVPSGESFTTTLTQLPAHTQFTWIALTVGLTQQPNEGLDGVSYTLTVDGQPVPIDATAFNGDIGITINVPFVVHTSDSATISLTISEQSSSDTFKVFGEDVEAGQDAWINPVQTESWRDGQQPAILDLVRGDDSGTPQAPSQAQDIYFSIASSDGVQPGLVQSDGSTAPADPNASYADFGVTLSGQSGGVTYDPNTGLFKVTIPAGQSSVELDFIPINLPGELSVYPKPYEVSISPSPTDPNTQLGFDFNAPATNPTTGASTEPFADVALHGLQTENSNTGIDQQKLDNLVAQLDDPDPSVRQAAFDAIIGMVNGELTGRLTAS
jgi:hypothetical protein